MDRQRLQSRAAAHNFDDMISREGVASRKDSSPKDCELFEEIPGGKSLGDESMDNPLDIYLRISVPK